MTTNLKEQLTTHWVETHTFPFIEDEDANITGYGHQDKQQFAQSVNEYDLLVNSGSPFFDPEDFNLTSSDVDHTWVTISDDEEEFTITDADDPDAVPVTAIWYIR